jgi:proline dehydrogenase
MARTITQHYCNLFYAIKEEQLDCNVSVKPTHIGLDISLAETMANVHRIIQSAKDTDNFLRLDMENSSFTDATLELYNHCINIHPKSGVVFQAYLYRSYNDVMDHTSPQFNARICKGIYKESENIAYQKDSDIVDNFIRIVHKILNDSGYCAIATHDLGLIDKLESWIEENNIQKHHFEFQVLYGVPMSGKLEELLSKGYTVRVYVPFGYAWFDYSIRRLKENPSIIGYVIKNLFKQK